MKGYRLKITIKGSNPPIWRRMTIPAGLSFCQLGVLLNEAIGWRGDHLSRFEFKNLGVNIENDIDEYEVWEYDEANMLEARETIIDSYLDSEKNFDYRYDFGDNWQHGVVIEEKIDNYDKDYAEVLQCKGGIPYENCGGTDTRFTAPYDMEYVNRKLRRGCTSHQMMPMEETTVTLNQILSCYRKEDLKDIAKIHHLTGISKYKKQELVEFLSRELLDGDVMREYLRFAPKEELELLESGANRIVTDVGTNHYTYLVTGGYVGYVNQWTGSEIHVPDEVKKAYRANCDTAWKKNWEHEKELLMYLNASAELYGICPIERVLDLYKRDTGKEENLFQVYSCCESVPENKKCFQIKGNEIIINECLEEEMYEILSNEQKGIPFYVPTKEEIEWLGKKGYLPFDKSMKQLKAFFIKEAHEYEEEADLLCRTIQVIIRIGGSLENVLDVLDKGCMEFDELMENARTKKRLLDKLENARMNTRTLFKRGNTIQELNTEEENKGKKQEKKADEPRNNIIPFPGR